MLHWENDILVIEVAMHENFVCFVVQETQKLSERMQSMEKSAEEAEEQITVPVNPPEDIYDIIKEKGVRYSVCLS